MITTELDRPQVRDVGDQIRRWREEGAHAKADVWQERLGLLCSVTGCHSPAATTGRLCVRHLPVYVGPLEAPEADRAAAIIERDPALSDEIISDITRVPIGAVKNERKAWRRRHGAPHGRRAAMLRACDVISRHASWPDSWLAPLAGVSRSTILEARLQLRVWGVQA